MKEQVANQRRVWRGCGITFLVVVALGIAGYKFLAFEFRPMNSLPYWRQPVIVERDIMEPLLYNAYGINTTTWVDDVFLVTPRYWINGINPTVRPDSTGRGRIKISTTRPPKPVYVSLVNNGNMQPTVSAVGDNNVLINVHPQTGMPHVLMYNLKRHVYTPVKGALSGRGN